MRKLVGRIDKHIVLFKNTWIHRAIRHFYVLLESPSNKLYERVSFGDEDEGITYALIQKDAHTNSGLFEDYVNFIFVIDYAISKKWIPVVDRLNFPGFIQQEPDTWYKENAWEYFFEQPQKYATVEWVQSNAKNAILMKTTLVYDALEVMPEEAKSFLKLLANPSNEIENITSKRFMMLAKEYLRLNEKTQILLSKIEGLAFAKTKKDKVLGVSLREEMFYRKEPTGIEIDNNILVEMINTKLTECGCNKIFIASEFESRIIWAKTVWGEERVISLNRKRPFDANDEKDKLCREWKDYSIEGTMEIMKIDAELYGNKSEKWFNYLAEIYCLSKCNSAIMQVSSGNIGAVLMNGGNYDAVYIL